MVLPEVYAAAIVISEKLVSFLPLRCQFADIARVLVADAVKFIALRKQTTLETKGEVIVNFSISITVTLNVHDAVLPELSVARKVFAVSPIGKTSPLAKPEVFETVAEQLSVAETAYENFTPHFPKSVFIFISVGQVKTGFSASSTVILNVQVAVF